MTKLVAVAPMACSFEMPSTIGSREVHSSPASTVCTPASDSRPLGPCSTVDPQYGMSMLRAMDLASLEAEHGDTASAFDHVTAAIRNYHDSGNTEIDARPVRCPHSIVQPTGTPRIIGHHCGFRP